MKYNQLVKEYNNLQNINKKMNIQNMMNNGGIGIPSGGYPNVSASFGGKEYMSKTVVLRLPEGRYIMWSL